MFETASRFLQRLRSDKSGNTLAIMAAAFLPLAGLIGGGVDMSRIYITKTRLQQACDAGALAGRKEMGSGSWTTGPNSSQSQAYQLFASNFKSGHLGTGPLTRNFVESEGTVTGTASTTVPMTLMQIFGYSDHNVSVTCRAKMEIPNTDVMFVLDLTYSMLTDNRIGGLRSATKCFYEALLKVNTTEVCGSDPTATSYDGTAQIRLGFVPYAVNVNVGRLLPNAYLSDEWAYQSRQPNFTTVYSWTVGSPGTTNWNSWSAAPSNLNSAAGYSGWTDLPSSPATVNVNGTDLATRPTGYNSTTCDSLNTMGPTGNRMRAYTDTGSVQTATQTGTPAAPVHPATDQAVNYSQNDNHTARGYRYLWGTSGTDSCRLQRSNTRTYTLTRTGSANKPVTWTSHQSFVNWTYSPRTLPVSGLKAGGTNANPSWNSTLTLTNFNTQTGPSVTLSGSNTPTQLTIPADASVPWEGCIIERPTYQNTDGDLSDDWDPVPSAALDMVIDHVPSGSTVGQAWGPMLDDVVWGRTTGGNRTLDPVTSTSTSTTTFPRGSYYCPSSAARKLREYDTLGDLGTYIDGFAAQGMGTYHDIGMLWGARLLSPTGMFGSENALTANGGAIERHLIFMTDGEAYPFVDNLYYHGLPWWDRRQTSYVATQDHLRGGINGRLSALCTAIKNMNIELWVISFGPGVTADEARLSACASPGRYYTAADNAALISRFKQIASEIADLRLTQ